ncbi:hypothetical protein GAO09_26095 [Rhizobiales bacterium RZME27]|uniref:Uncharacterized protein n=1 Tax=Endobacterium cereale TaxID=2663029 RepID=A0A6A8ALB9_9HYPH|nr:ankyrin repeat domain-containing protein [Endobacterium cereale]MEB2843901.1 ankyrin repeat domain-containing protein [Endobacterium cereale]MQY49511.1 hypothetical protein [Endobacterium cereale]
MPNAKTKTLPKDFEAILASGDAEAIRSVFDACDVNARGGVFKQTALAFNELPDEIAHWLIANGADLQAPDSYGETPLHSRAGHWQGRITGLIELGADVHAVDTRGNTPLHNAANVGNAETVKILLANGARKEAANNQGLSPLEHALQRCTNPGIPQLVEVADLILNTRPQQKASAKSFAARLFGRAPKETDPVSARMREFVQKIGANFEFHRAGFNPESRDATSAALDRLYVLFNVPPVPRRSLHDGVSPIIASASTWPDRHEELWELLVPSSGHAATVQGEVIRISGRISRELDGNGGINWDADFKLMADALLDHLGSGKALPSPDLQEAAGIVSDVKRKRGDTDRLAELAVQWVALNPKPLPLPLPAYSR